MRFSINKQSMLRHAIFSLLLLWVLAPWSGTAQAARIDIMLVYDTTATTWVAANGGMAAFSEDAVNRMNQAMQNSGLSTTFRLVHSMKVDYTTQSLLSQSFIRDLEALQSGSGVFSSVAAERDAYGADLVAMLVDHGSEYGSVGLGYALQRWSGHPQYAHTVTAIRSVAMSHTLTHEVGHNLGADHAKNQLSSPGPNEALDNQYSAGWYFTGGNGRSYHTIMAYGDDGYGNRYDEAPLFSTPLKRYQGTPAGDARDGDNTRLISETQSVIAAYRAEKKPDAPIGDYDKQVYVMYAGYFGRPPAYSGFSYYADWMRRTNGNYLIIVDDFFRSTESRALYSGRSTEEQIKLVFRFLFARQPAAAGLNYWKDRIDRGLTSVAQMAYTIAYNAASADQEILSAKIEVAKAFVAELERVQKTQTCSMDVDFARDFWDQIKTRADADAAVLNIGGTVQTMCQ